MKWATLALALSGCQPGRGALPGDLTGAYVAMLCLLNCPLSVNLSGPDAVVTDVVPQKGIHIMPETVRAINEGKGR